MIKYVIFDVGGVLLDWKAGLNAVSNKLEVSQDDLLNFLLQYLSDLELGRITDDTFWKAVKTHYKSKISYFELAQTWVNEQKHIESGWHLVKELNKNGVKTGLFTNNWLGVMEYLINKNPDFSYFSYIFDSSQEKIRKPNTDSYKQLEQSLGLKGDEILFIDDSPQNIDAALEMGWVAFLYKGDLFDINKKILKTLGLKIMQ